MKSYTRIYQYAGILMAISSPIVVILLSLTTLPSLSNILFFIGIMLFLSVFYFKIIEMCNELNICYRNPTRIISVGKEILKNSLAGKGEIIYDSENIEELIAVKCLKKYMKTKMAP